MAGHRRKRLGIADPPHGKYAPFEPGNAVAVVHGASTERLVSPLAQILRAEYAGVAEYLARPMFAGALMALCEAEAQEYLYLRWMEGLPGDSKYRAKGAQQPPIATWGKLAERSAARRKDCGLTPLTYARIGKAMASAKLDIARMAAEMARAEGYDPDGYGDDDEGRDEDL